MRGEYIAPYSLKFIFAWYDLWIGFFIDRKKKLIYFFPVPMVGVRFKYGYLKYSPDQPQKESDIDCFKQVATITLPEKPDNSAHTLASNG